MEGNKVIDFGSDQKINFVLTIDNESSTPMWAAEVDDILLLAIADGFYRYSKDHPIIVMGSNLTDKKAFTYTENINTFKNSLLIGVSNIFKDAVLGFANAIINLPSTYTVISLFGKNSENYITAIVDNEVIRVDVSVK